MLPDLDAVRAYQNASVITQFCAEHAGTSRERAHEIFTDLLGWLWLSEHRLQNHLTTHMIAPLKTIDSMWHVFILHTRAYSEFCQHYFGRYLHHEVESDAGAAQLSTEELSAYLNDCYDHLGEAWLLRNFDGVL